MTRPIGTLIADIVPPQGVKTPARAISLLPGPLHQLVRKDGDGWIPDGQPVDVTGAVHLACSVLTGDMRAATAPLTLYTLAMAVVVLHYEKEPPRDAEDLHRLWAAFITARQICWDNPTPEAGIAAGKAFGAYLTAVGTP